MDEKLKTGETPRNFEDFDAVRQRVWSDDAQKEKRSAEELQSLQQPGVDGKTYGTKLSEKRTQELSAFMERLKQDADPKEKDTWFALLRQQAEAPEGGDKMQKEFAQSMLSVLHALTEREMMPGGWSYPKNPLQCLKDYLAADQQQPDITKKDYLTDRMRQTERLGDNIIALRKSLKRAEEMLDKCMLYPQSDSKEFRQFYANLKDLQQAADELYGGKLMVPGDGVETLDGKKVHHIRAVTTVQKDGKKEEAGPEKTTVQVNTDGTDKTYTWTYADMRDRPLFPRPPRPEDVVQGHLGDCYMLSSLAAVAAQNPEKLMEAMRDNDDGTVTVRFYNKQKEPVFVTVDKTVPYLEHVNTKKDKDAYAFDCLWAQLFEKAYVASGLHNDYVRTSEQMESGQARGKYEDIIGGQTENFLPMLLGEKSEHCRETNESPSIPFFSPMLGGGYSRSEEAFYSRLKDAFDSGCIVACSIDPVPRHVFSDFTGLTKGHAYTMVGVEKDPDGEIYVRIRNPHAKEIRKYDADGKPVAVPLEQMDPATDRPGESRMKLRDFESTFDNVNIVSCDMSPLERVNRQEADAYQRRYGKPVLKACSMILESDNVLLRALPFDSKQFNALRKAAIAAQKEMSAKTPDADRMQKAMKALTDASEAYRNYRDKQVRDPQKEERQRAVNRYYAAEMLCQLGDFIKSNEALEPALREDANPTSLHRKALRLSDDMSPARRAMADDMRFRLDLPGLELPLIPPEEDLDLMVTHAEHSATMAAQAQDTEEFIHSAAAAYLYGDVLRDSTRLSTPAPERKLPDPETAEAQIRALEPKVKQLIRHSDEHQRKELLAGKNIPGVLKQVRSQMERKSVPEAPQAQAQPQTGGIK